MTEQETTQDLLAQLHDANERARTDPDSVLVARSEARTQASEYFLRTYLSGPEAVATLEREMLSRAAQGDKTYRLTSWIGSGPCYMGQHLPDLLDLGTLLQDMQDWLDATYAVNGRRLRIFNCHVRGTNSKTNLIISWNEERFPQADQIIESNRTAALERRENYERRRDNRGNGNGNGKADGEAEGEAESDTPKQTQSQSRGGDYGRSRGGNGNGNDRGNGRGGDRRGQGQGQNRSQGTRRDDRDSKGPRQGQGQGQGQGPRRYDYDN